MRAIFYKKDRSDSFEDLSNKSEGERANLFISRGEHGLSSLAIWSQMVGAADGAIMSYPSDPSDLNRCLKLLSLVPEWKSRITEMSLHGIEWKALSENWQALEDCFIGEVGVNWSKSDSAPKTYKMMKELTK